MTDQELISKIQQLKDIKPKQDWVLSVKNRIITEHPYIAKKTEVSLSMADIIKSWVLQPKLDYIPFVLIFGIFVAAFSFANTALPGDALYPFKKITEGGQSIFILDNKTQSATQLELLNKRLDELTEIATKNKVKNLAPAINEVEHSITKAAKNLKQADTNPEIVSKIKTIEDKKDMIKSLGVEIGELEWDAALVGKIKTQVDILSAEKLTAEQASVLEEVKKDIDGQEYVAAWEKVLSINGIEIK